MRATKAWTVWHEAAKHSTAPSFHGRKVYSGESYHGINRSDLNLLLKLREFFSAHLRRDIVVEIEFIKR